VAEPSNRSRRLLVSARYLAPLVALAERIAPGPARDEILDLLKAPAEAEPGGQVRLADCCRLMRALSIGAGDETFDLSARPMMAGAAEMVFSRAAQAETLGDAMREVAHGYNVLHGGAYNRVESRGQTLAYVIDDARFPYTRARDDYLHFALEFALIFVHAAVCELANADLTPAVRRVSTQRGEAARDGEALGFWDAPVAWGEPVYAVVYDASAGARPLSRKPRQMRLDLAIHNRILTLIEAREAAAGRGDGVREAVLRALGDGLYDQSAIAERLGISTATLRRRLTAEGASFRALLQEVLKQQACLRLAETGDVGETAETLGFSDPRSFTRAFKAWTGETPSRFMGRNRRALAS
jgi:AraC-like DNA-binding protein